MYDGSARLLRTYGARGEKSMYGKKFMGVVRSSVVIDARGKVAAVFAKIQPAHQSKKSLEVVREMVDQNT